MTSALLLAPFTFALLVAQKAKFAHMPSIGQVAVVLLP